MDPLRYRASQYSGCYSALGLLTTIHRTLVLVHLNILATPGIPSAYSNNIHPRKHVPLGKLCLKFKPRSTVNRICPDIKRRHLANKFLKIGNADVNSKRHTLICGKDGAILAYHVPAAYLHSCGVNTDLDQSIERLEPKKVKRTRQGVYRSDALEPSDPSFLL